MPVFKMPQPQHKNLVNLNKCFTFTCDNHWQISGNLLKPCNLTHRDFFNKNM